MKRIKNHTYNAIYTEKQARKCTDVVWTVISAAFAIAMFVIACVKWNRGRFQELYEGYYNGNNLAFCSDQRSLYIPDPENTQVQRSRQCVKNCPESFTDFKGLCLPNSEEKRQKYLDNPDLALKIYSSKTPNVLFYTIIIALSLGLLNLTIVFLWPRFSAKFSFIWCLLLLLAVGILLLVIYDHFWKQVTFLKIIVAILCFFICILIISMVWLFSNEIKLYGIFLSYAVKFLQQNFSTMLYIPLFLFFAACFTALIVWQHVCFMSSSQATDLYLYNMTTGVFNIFNFIQLFWGIQFLRDAFNYCVGGNFVDWFFKKNQGCCGSFRRLICLNWGSVVAGSFINAFFQIPNLIFQLFRCHPNTCCNRAGNKCATSFNCCSSIFDLIRTDTYSFINISGENLCTSSAYCRQLCDNSEMFVGMQSPMKHYRLMMHVTYISAVFLISWFIQRYLVQYYGIWNNIFVVLVSLLCVTWFISIFSDIGEAAQTCFLTEREIQGDYGKMIGVDEEFRGDFYHHEKRVRKDGSC